MSLSLRTHWKHALLVTSLALGGATLAHAGARHMSDECREMVAQGAPMAQAVEQLDNLSAEQKAQLESLFEEHHKARHQLRQQQRETRRALRDAFREGADKATLTPLAEQAGRLSTQRILLRAELRDSLAGVLSPAQFEQLAAARKALRKEMREKCRGQRHGHRHQGERHGDRNGW